MGHFIAFADQRFADHTPVIFAIAISSRQILNPVDARTEAVAPCTRLSLLAASGLTGPVSQIAAEFSSAAKVNHFKRRRQDAHQTIATKRVATVRSAVVPGLRPPALSSRSQTSNSPSRVRLLSRIKAMLEPRRAAAHSLGCHAAVFARDMAVGKRREKAEIDRQRCPSRSGQRAPRRRAGQPASKISAKPVEYCCAMRSRSAASAIA